MSLTKSASFHRSVLSDSIPRRSDTIASTFTPGANTPENVDEDLEAERVVGRVTKVHRSGKYGVEYDKINRQRWIQLPRLSTACDLPMLQLSINKTVSRIDSLQFSNDELLETLSKAPSSDEESMLNAAQSSGGPSTPEDKANVVTGLRRVMSTSSTKLKRMGSKLRRVPSTLLAKSVNQDLIGSFSERKTAPSTPGQDTLTIQSEPLPRRSISRALSRVFTRGKENQRSANTTRSSTSVPVVAHRQ